MSGRRRSPVPAPSEGWRARDACRGMDPALFFFERGDACPVRRDCLIEGLHEAAGVWGGLVLLRRRRVARVARTQGWEATWRLADELARGVVDDPTGVSSHGTQGYRDGCRCRRCTAAASAERTRARRARRSA